MSGEDLLVEVQNFRTWGALLSLAVLLGWETLFPYFREFKNGFRERSLHATRNLSFAVINFIIGAVFFGSTWGTASLFAEQNSLGILNWLGLGLWGHLIGAIVLWDFWTYWWHRFNHEIPFLWRFHRVHHSDPQMDVTTAYRFHMGEIFLSSCLRIPLIVLFGTHLWELVLYELFLFFVVQFHHANITVSEPVDRAIRVVIPSPYMHKIHHSDHHSEFNTNYTSLFSVWDRLFGSYCMRPDIENIRFGMPGLSDPERQKISELLACPLRD